MIQEIWTLFQVACCFGEMLVCNRSQLLLFQTEGRVYSSHKCFFLRRSVSQSCNNKPIRLDFYMCGTLCSSCLNSGFSEGNLIAAAERRSAATE